MKQALQNGFIDAAVVATRTEDWRPVPLVATTPEEVLRGRGPKYTACPMVEGVWEAIDRGYEKIAMVGTLGGNLIRDVRPGEVLVIEPSGDLESQQLYRGIHSAHCVFEYIYFARPVPFWMGG